MGWDRIHPQGHAQLPFCQLQNPMASNTLHIGMDSPRIPNPNLPRVSQHGSPETNLEKHQPLMYNPQTQTPVASDAHSKPSR